MPVTLKLAVCLFTHVTNLDYGGPLELLGFLRPEAVAAGYATELDYIIEPTYLHYDLTPFRGSMVGPLIVPDRAYDDVKEGEQFDILLVPGGMFYFSHTSHGLLHGSFKS